VWQRMPGKSRWARYPIVAIAIAAAVVAAAAETSVPVSSASGTTSAAKPAKGKPTHYTPDRFAGRAGTYYLQVWGIDSISVKLVESGELVRFSFRVVEPTKAGALNDKRNEPSLVDAQAGVSLVVPTMEKVGQLRQTSTPEAGRSYWMTFSNKGRHVKRGDRVDVLIGPFQAKNLVVD
jgi:hypothetical protein